jgi:hypothetical protein
MPTAGPSAQLTPQILPATCADGNAFGIDLLKFFVRKFPAALFWTFRAQNLGP